MDESLAKLDTICNFLKTSSKYHFQNYNIPLFAKFIQDDEVLNGIMEDLLSRYPTVVKHAKELASGDTIKIGGKNLSLAQYRSAGEIEDFDSWVAFCYGYIKHIDRNQGGRVLSYFTYTSIPKLEEEKLKELFYNDCIEPIRLFITLQVKNEIQAMAILNRYKVRCEWYDRKELLGMKETSITQGHLSKHLFEAGYTYTLTETNVPSGRIDVLASSLGISSSELSKLPNAIVIEGKIYRGQQVVVSKVINQVQKRINELNFDAGYCVVYNVSNKQLNLVNTSGIVNGQHYLIMGNKRIYMLIVNLHDDFYSSTTGLSPEEIDCGELM